MIIASICARGGSKGVPRKNLRRIAGVSLLERAIESAQACSIVDRIVVSTDDEEIAALAKSAGAEVPFIRPVELARDTSPKWPVFQHLLEMVEKDGTSVDILADLDAACPLRAPEDIAGAVDLLRESDAEVVITAYAPERNPYFNMVEIADDGFAKVVKSLPRPVTSRQEAPRVFSLSPSVFAISRGALRRYAHWSEAKVLLHEIPRHRALDIDSEFDMQLAEFLIESATRTHA